MPSVDVSSHQSRLNQSSLLTVILLRANCQTGIKIYPQVKLLITTVQCSNANKSMLPDSQNAVSVQYEKERHGVDLLTSSSWLLMSSSPLTTQR